MMPVKLNLETHAEWLLWSLETMAKDERSQKTLTTEARTAQVLRSALLEHWAPKTEIDLASAAGCSPGSIHKAKTQGFNIKSKAVARMFDAMKLDFKAACFEFSLRPAKPKTSSLMDIASSLVGTDQEESAAKHLLSLANKAKR